MSWQEITDKDFWNNFLTQSQNPTFLQSWEFGDFYLSINKKIWRLGESEGKKLQSICLLVKQETKLGSFLYSPGGPIVTKESLQTLIEKAKEIATEEQVSFVRFDPRIVANEVEEEFKKLGLVEASGFTQPQTSLLLDLTKTEEELRHGLSESTRYNVGWVTRQGLRVEVSQKDEEIEIFLRLLEETSARQNFSLTGEKDYYKKQFLTLKKEGLTKLYLTYEPEKDGKEVLAAAIVVTFGKMTTYLHAASSSKSPKLRAPYLQQWQIIMDAKNSGSEVYDFWGIAKSDSKSDPWAGVTSFKKSFGGEMVTYEKPFDLALSNKYHLDKIIERARLFKRKFR
ncbi:MAG TPA: peptidoglycan bridge formation glycyltransferase FemA/FemB family protein [Candidatus Saccharimonadales bacterium]|nr:peptidoglycan bridge formation glycyltransferase FemA/FemB family protein [Candidatus Saccharimonadales bacterium]